MPRLFAVLLFLLVGCSGQEKQEFDSASWKKGDREIRGSMINSLETSDTLLEKTYGEVVRLLGEPDIMSSDSSDISYELYTGQDVGPFGLGGPWVFWLNVDFDSSGKVNDYHASD